MKVLWYPKNVKLLKAQPDRILRTSTRMRVYNRHECLKLKPDVRSDIAECTVNRPDPFRYDAVVFAKFIDRDLARALKRQGTAVVWDICDPAKMPPDIAGSVDVIVTSSHELREHCLRQNAKLTVDVIEEGFEGDVTAGKTHADREKLLVTWYGIDESYRKHVRPLVPLLRKLDFVEWRWAGSDTEKNRQEQGFVPGVAFNMDWRTARKEPHSWLSFIHSSDVGIVPVAGEIKSNHKILNYMAYGIPVVCSPTDAHGKIIRHGENGFLAGSEQEWTACLQQLRDPGLRQRIGTQARRDVGDFATVEKMADAYLDLISRQISQKKSMRPSVLSRVAGFYYKRRYTLGQRAKVFSKQNGEKNKAIRQKREQ